MSEKSGGLAVCVATIRPDEIARYLCQWAPLLAAQFGRSGISRVAFFIHEDSPERRFTAPEPSPARVVHTCHRDIREVLGVASWIIPKGSGASRSFPMYLAWREGFEYVVTMDDDCFPPDDEPESFFDNHLRAFRLDRWFRTIGGEEPRGVPYGNKGSLPVLLNHGLWTGIPDFDGPTALVRSRWPMSVVLRKGIEVIPPGMWFTLCAMNVCYHRRAIPAAYNLLMGVETAGFDRFDDIWSGLFLKKIADDLGFYVTNGGPFVRHLKASNPFSNLCKESLGIALHEEFWQHVSTARLEKCESVTQAYTNLAAWVRQFPKRSPKAPAKPGYFERLAEAMAVWASLFGASE
jgi:hypothetical protein